MPVSSPKLPLTTIEKEQLRSFRVKLREIAQLNVNQLSHYLGSSIERARYIRALAQFQSVPSIGLKVAERVILLGYYSLEEIRCQDGAELINRLEEKLGYWEDPCLEDSFRCIVYHANHSGSDKNWFDFTAERKKYREKYGYPATRPKTAWYEKNRTKGYQVR